MCSAHLHIQKEREKSGVGDVSFVLRHIYLCIDPSIVFTQRFIYRQTFKKCPVR